MQGIMVNSLQIVVKHSPPPSSLIATARSSAAAAVDVDDDDDGCDGSDDWTGAEDDNETALGEL